MIKIFKYFTVSEIPTIELKLVLGSPVARHQPKEKRADSGRWLLRWQRVGLQTLLAHQQQAAAAAGGGGGGQGRADHVSGCE